MGIAKTVLIILASLLLGGILSVGGTIIYQQQVMLQDQEFRISVLEKVATKTMSDEQDTDSRLTDTIKTANHNFSTIRKRQDNLEDILKLMIQALKAGDDNSPSVYKRNGNG